MKYLVARGGAFALGLLCAGHAPGESVTRQVLAMGTHLTVTIEAPTRSTAVVASERAIAAIEEVEARLSTWREASELSRLNSAPAGTLRLLSASTRAELTRALACAQATGGAFDPTLGALVDAWDLRGAGRVPSLEERTDALATRGIRWLSLTERGAIRLAPGLRIEEGGFGKGAGLDAAARALRELPGVTSARLDFGGQVLLLGTAQEVVAIANPDRRNEAAATVRIAGGSLATSGNGEALRRVGGRKIGHLLDPRTGELAADFGSMTVWAPDALLADCLSTGLFVLGPERALGWRREHPDLQVEILALERTVAPGGDLRLWVSEGWENRVQAVSSAVRRRGSPTVAR